MDRLRAEAKSVFNAQVKDSSRKSYRCSQLKFLLWFRGKNPAVLGLAFRARIDGLPDDKQRKSFMTTVLTPPVNHEFPPLNWDALTSEDFTSWLLSLRKAGKPAVAG